jgi:hypothetical protein
MCAEMSTGRSALLRELNRTGCRTRAKTAARSATATVAHDLSKAQISGHLGLARRTQQSRVSLTGAQGRTLVRKTFGRHWGRAEP